MAKDILTGCDLSHHNLSSVVKEATSVADFCCIKITEGETYKDKRAKDNVQAAVKNGVKLIVLYHYCRPDLHVRCETEVNHFLVQANEIIRDYTGYSEVKWALAFDWEDKSVGMEEWLVNAVKVLEDNTGHKPFVYANEYTWLNRIGKWSQLMECPRWIAKWSLQKPKLGYDIWQYTNEPYDRDSSNDLKLGELFTYQPKLTTEDVQGDYHECHCCCAGKCGDGE